MIKVSVLIPTYNLAHHLGETIESVLNQRYDNFELIIVDDNSSDNTTNIVKKYLSDKRVKYIKNDKNLGIQGNFNKCLLEASGEYIKFLNHDDTFHPDLLEEYITVMDTHPNVSVVTALVEDMDNPNEIVFKPIEVGLIKGDDAIREYLVQDKCIGEPTSVMFRRSSLWVGLFNSTITWGLDREMWMRQLTVGDLYVIPKILSSKRFHDKATSSYIYENFIHCFEDYFFAVNIRNAQLYSLSQKDTKKIMERKIKLIIACIPCMIKVKNFKAIKKAFSILRYEGYLIYGLYKIASETFGKSGGMKRCKSLKAAITA